MTVKPINASAPTTAIRSGGVPLSTKAHVAPSSVSGSETSTSSGMVSDSKVTASTANSTRITGTRILRNQLNDAVGSGVSIV